MYICVHGRRIRKSTGTTNKKEAQKIHDELKVSLWNQKVSQYSWHDAVIAWLKSSPRGEPDRYRLKAFTLPNMPLSDLTQAVIEPHLPKIPGTYNRMVGLVQAILNHAKASGQVDNVPRLMKKKIAEQRVRWLTQAEWERLKIELPDHLRAMATFAVFTGLRKSNVTSLEWSQVDLVRKVAWIHPDQAKAGKPICVPLSENAFCVLAEQVGKHPERVFTYKGHPITGIKSAWGKALQRAGLGRFENVQGETVFVPDFRWHDLRHTWATWHVQSGTPLAVLQKLGGWADIKMVLRYAHFAPDYLSQFADNAKPYATTDAA
ncbi:tyrosine-type recombinase/integrase [Ferrovum myxofaciens]|uniref:tyrosine-type recombinase/integrase n=1 Tax=Ferrovum myxofaciens TaxID=416213 RepID=UPI003EB6CDFE